MNEYALLIPYFNTYFAIKGNDIPTEATPLFKVTKLLGVIAATHALNPYVSQAAKSIGKKLGYIKKSKKENQEPVNVN